MSSISIGASKNTTGLLSGGGLDYDPDTTNTRSETEAPEVSKNWFGGRGIGGGLPSLKAPDNKNNKALSLATSLASSAASATAGAIATGAKAATKAVVDRAANARETSNGTNNSNCGGKTTPKWRRMPWSRPGNANDSAEASPASKVEGASTGPSWAQASSGSDMNSNNDYGVSNHLPESRRQSLSAAWNNRPRVVLPSLSFPRRNTSPSIFGGRRGAEEDDAAKLAAHLAFYGDLMLLPPATITFVIQRRQSDGGNTTEGAASNRDKLRDILGVRLVKSPATQHRFQVVRDDWTDDGEAEGESEGQSSAGVAPETETPPTNEGQPSLASPLLPQELSVLLRPGDFLESVNGVPVGGRRIMALGRNRCWDEEGLSKVILATGEKSTTNGSQSEPDSGKIENPIPEGGDEERKVQSKSCYYTTTLTFVCSGTIASSDTLTQSVSESSSTNETAVDSSKASESVETSSSVTMISVDASTEKESPTTPKPSNIPTPILHRAYFVDQTRGNFYREEETSMEDVLENFLALPTTQKSGAMDPSKNRLGVGKKDSSSNGNNDPNSVGTSLLHIGSIPDDHWLGKQTKIREGDVVLCADDIPCYNGELSPADLSRVWRTALMTKVLVSDPIQDAISSSAAEAPHYVGITSCSIPPTVMATIRKRAVAVGGGALVGTGAVLMVTPLHPVGHAMAIGGLGVLGTEFEAPRKAFQKARESAANLAARVRKQQPAVRDDERLEHDDDEEDKDNDFVDASAPYSPPSVS